MKNKELAIIEKHKKELICPKCQSDLFNKDYKINLLTLILVLLCFISGVIVGSFI